MQRLPVLVLIAFCPDFISSWYGQALVSALSLDRMSRTRGALMAAALTGGKALPPKVLKEILATTDGLPLFIEFQDG